MRDQLDTQTTDLLPGKRGRPCADLDRGPMSAAERAKRYRDGRKRAGLEAARMTRAKAVGVLLEYSDLELLEGIRLERAFLERLLASTGNRGATPSRKRLGALVAELARRYPA